MIQYMSLAEETLDVALKNEDERTWQERTL